MDLFIFYIPEGGFGVVEKFVERAVVVEDVGVLGFFDVDSAAVALYAVGWDAIGKAKGWVAAYEDGDDVEGIGVFFEEHHQSFLVDDVGDDRVVA